MANEWNKTAFVEFETMLRRRLRSGAAPVVACAGFDLDAASAYLEGVLGGSHRTGYESHLAGCAACRRHLIELARLAQAIPRAGTQPVTVTDRIPAWVRWREVVAGWFDLSAWNLKWQMAGVAGVALVILIAALGAQSWRQASNLADRTSATIPTSTVEGYAQPFQSPTPEHSPQDVAISSAVGLFSVDRDQLQVPVPTPPVSLKEGAPEVAVSPLLESLALRVNESGEPPVTAKPGGAEAGQNPPPQPGASVAMDDSAQGARITPPHGYNPMNPGQPKPGPNFSTLALNEDGRMTPVSSQSSEPSPRAKAPDKKSSEPLKMPGFVTSLLPRIKSKSKSEAVRKENAEASEDKSPKPMLIPIRDKLFRFEKGMLIDGEYKSERDEWNVWTLKRGSESYKQVLAEEPLLKEFFDRGSILIVWKNRIYKVQK